MIRDTATTVHLLKIRAALGLKHRPRRLPKQKYPKTIQLDYARAILERFVQPMRRIFQPLLDELPRLVAFAIKERTDARTDAGEGKRAAQLISEARRRMQEAIQPDAVEQLAQLFAQRISTTQRIALGKQVKAALGADVFMSDRRLPAIVGNFVQQNVALIKSVPNQLADDIEKTVQNALTSGTLHTDLADELEERFGFSEDRAKLIARDQVGKLYGQINAARQKDLGVKRFIWRTVDDNCVRDEHHDREVESEETPYSYDDPPDGELPGEPINCRCTAEPVLSDLLADDTTDDEE